MAAPATDNDEFTLFDYAAVVARRRYSVLVPAVLLVVMVGLYTANQPPSYRATARVLLADSAAQRALDPGSQNTGFLSRELSNEISLATSDTVEDLVVDALGDLPEVRISAESASDVLVFTASAATDDDAALAANTWAEQYVAVKRTDAVANITAATTNLQARLEQLRIERQELRDPLDELDERIAGAETPEAAAALQREHDRLSNDLGYELELVTGQAEATLASLNELQLQAELSSVGEARIIQIAAPPDQPSNAPLSRNLALAAVIGLFLGLAVALFADARDTTITNSADIAAITDLPLLTVVPLAKRAGKTGIELASLVEPEGMVADGYHKLRSALEFISFDRNISSIMVTSANAAEGKSTTSSNLAVALSSVGKRTLLADVDFRRPRIHTIFGANQAPGLTDLVVDAAAPSAISQKVKGAELWVVPAGTTPPNPASFVGTHEFLSTIDWLGSEADVVVLDAPPILAVSEAHTLGKHVDAVVLAAMAKKTTRKDLQEVIATLTQAGANLIGVVLAGVAESDSYARNREYYTTNAQSSSNRRQRSPSREQNTAHPVTSPTPPADAALSGAGAVLSGDDAVLADAVPPDHDVALSSNDAVLADAGDTSVFEGEPGPALAPPVPTGSGPLNALDWGTASGVGNDTTSAPAGDFADDGPYNDIRLSGHVAPTPQSQPVGDIRLPGVSAPASPAAPMAPANSAYPANSAETEAHDPLNVATVIDLTDPTKGPADRPPSTGRRRRAAGRSGHPPDHRHR